LKVAVRSFVHQRSVSRMSGVPSRGKNVSTAGNPISSSRRKIRYHAEEML